MLSRLCTTVSDAGGQAERFVPGRGGRQTGPVLAGECRCLLRSQHSNTATAGVMVLPRKVVCLFVGVATVQWRHGGGGGAYAAVLSSYPEYCGKDMDLNSIPSLDDSVQASFGGGVSLDDVELLQVSSCHFLSCPCPATAGREIERQYENVMNCCVLV